MPWDIFLSYEDEDIGTVEVFREHLLQEDIDLVLHEYPIKEPFESMVAKNEKSHITEMLEKTSITVVLIGRTTYADKWVDWEVRKSANLGKGLLGVRLHSDLDHIVPRALKDYKVEVIDPNARSVAEAIEKIAREEGHYGFETG
jgi:hypothetical protein